MFLQNYNVISLFLLTNILNASATIPILMGLWRGKLAYRIITPASALFGCILGLISVIVYAILQAPHWGVSNNEALHSVFLGELIRPYLHVLRTQFVLELLSASSRVY